MLPLDKARVVNFHDSSYHTFSCMNHGCHILINWQGTTVYVEHQTMKALGDRGRITTVTSSRANCPSTTDETDCFDGHSSH